MHNTQEKDSGKRIKIFNTLQIANNKAPVGSLRKLKVGQLSLCLAHTELGWYALQNECPHHGACLSSGKLSLRNQVICPLHQYAYNLQTGAEGGQRTGLAKVYTVKEEGGAVYIYL